MSDIDPEKLEKAIAYYGDDARENEGAPKLGLIIKAARAHLATLPRFKEVEVAVWGRVVGGRLMGWSENREEVDENVLRYGGHVVRLTGTAKVRAWPTGSTPAIPCPRGGNCMV